MSLKLILWVMKAYNLYFYVKNKSSCSKTCFFHKFRLNIMIWEISS